MSRCGDCGHRFCPDWCGADPHELYEENENLESELTELKEENEDLKRRIKIATKMVYNIREYSLIYTPIKESCQEVLRVLKGRDVSNKS